MKTLTLKIKGVRILNEIQKALSENKQLSQNELSILSDFLLQLPASTDLLEKKIALDELFEVKVLDIDKIEEVLNQWRKLFYILPGWDYCPSCWIVDRDNIKLLRKNVVLNGWFAPSMAYNQSRDEPFQVYMKDDGTALFHLPTLEDAEQYPELYQFSGTWKEAFMLTLETVQKGWPMEEFPEELQKFLPKQ